MDIVKNKKKHSIESVEKNNLSHEITLFKKQLKITKLQNACLELEQADCPIEHHFSDGAYARTMRVKAGTFVIGKVHRYKTLNIMTKGKAIVYSGGNESSKKRTAPFTFVSNPMERKVFFFIEDSEWMNIHPTNETNIEEIEKKFIVPEKEYLEYLDKEAKLCLG